MNVLDLGVIGFADALSLQERLAAGIAGGDADETLLLLEHFPVYTVGSGGSTAHVLDPAVQVVRTNRGGDVTYHGPGQLVGYPLVNLDHRTRDLRRWLRFLEDVMLDVAASFGVDAGRVDGLTGVWTGRGKLGSIGVGVRRWVTMHGFSLNVSTDLDGFSRINPCGIEGCIMTSLEREAGTTISLQEVKDTTARRFLALLDKVLPCSCRDRAASIV